ncbi:MAG: DMT family transporter [Verrucomicrobiales bacterium]|nr:DMT family transporter [Verrucomicrobiales bacterium]MCP5556737.1 DMT family transporter [Verrucomicrobiaceae bacterium]
MRDYLQMHLVVIAWGFTAILGMLVQIPVLEVVVWRTGLAALGFCLVALSMRTRLRIVRKAALQLAGNGAILAMHWMLFFLAARLSTASVCLAAMPTAMLWCSLIEPLTDGTRRWNKMELAVGSVMVGAVWLIYHVEPRYWLGFSVGLVSALLAALFAVINKQLVRRWHFSTIGTYQMSGAFVISLAVLPFFPSLAGSLMTMPSAADIGWLLLLSLGCTVAAYAGYMDALRRLSVFQVNVIYNMEPVYGILLAAMIFGKKELMSPGFYVGAGIIVAVVLSLPRLRRWQNPGAT